MCSMCRCISAGPPLTDATKFPHARSNVPQDESNKSRSLFLMVQSMNEATKSLSSKINLLESIPVRNKNIMNELKCKKAIKKANKLMSISGRLLVRKSGTEPKIRIMGESHNKNLIIKCIKIIKKSITH